MNTEDIEALARDVPILVNDARELRAAVETDRAERRRAARRTSAILLIGALLTGALVVIALANRTIIHNLADCTDPTGHCYQETRRQTDAAVQAVIDRQTEANLRIVACTYGATSAHALRTCAEKALRRPMP